MAEINKYLNTVNILIFFSYVRDMDKRRYPKMWSVISELRRSWAEGKCECCGAEEGKPHPRFGYVVVLQTIHIDRNPLNTIWENLLAGCQTCHLTWDKGNNLERRKYGINFEVKQLRIWDGRY